MADYGPAFRVGNADLWAEHEALKKRVAELEAALREIAEGDAEIITDEYGEADVVDGPWARVARAALRTKRATDTGKARIEPSSLGTNRQPTSEA